MNFYKDVKYDFVTFFVMSTKAVRLDKEVLDTLAEEREGFETPNECLKRLLNGKTRTCIPEETEEVKDSES